MTKEERMNNTPRNNNSIMQQQLKRAPVRNGIAVSKLYLNVPGRHRLASTKDGHWMVFVDSNREGGEFLFLFNNPLQFMVNLPRLKHPLSRFLKCLLVSCSIVEDDKKLPICRYKICFIHRWKPSYVWNSNNLHHWQQEAYSANGDEFYVNAVLSESDGDDITRRLFGITSHGLLCGPNLRLQLPNTSVLYVWRQLIFKSSDQLFLLERKPQNAWEVWEIDITQRSCVSTNLDGLVIVFYGEESVGLSSFMFKPGLLEGNCIVLVDIKDHKTFHVHSLADQTRTILENKHNTGFPVCYPSARKNWMPWWSFVKDNLRETATSEEPDKITANEIAPLCSDESHGLINSYNNLPRELQSYIAESIKSPMDYANFRLVCKKWSEIARPIRWIPDASAQSPWLMLFQETKLSSSVIDPTCNMKYYMSNQELLGCKIRYSKDGWLLVTKGTRKVFFFEPFRRTKISLPDIPEEYFHPDGMSMSSSPASSDWVIISTENFIDHLVVMYLRSVDEKWSIVEVELNVLFVASGSNLVFHDNRFYYLAVSGDMAVFWWEADVFKYHVVVTANESQRFNCGYRDRGYLVSCEDKYLCLVIFPPLGNCIRLYLLDVVKPGLPYPTSRWKRMKSIGNFSFFISHTSSLALPVSKRSQQQNTINFPLFVDNRHLSYKWDTREFRYCNGSGNYIASTTEIYNRNESFAGTWLQPKVTRGYNYRPWKEGCELEHKD